MKDYMQYHHHHQHCGQPTSGATAAACKHWIKMKRNEMQVSNIHIHPIQEKINVSYVRKSISNKLTVIVVNCFIHSHYAKQTNDTKQNDDAVISHVSRLRNGDMCVSNAFPHCSIFSCLIMAIHRFVFLLLFHHHHHHHAFIGTDTAETAEQLMSQSYRCHLVCIQYTRW
jgi:hypothetical protein